MTEKVNHLAGELRVELDDSWAECHRVKRILKFLMAIATVEVLQSSHKSHSAVKRWPWSFPFLTMTKHPARRYVRERRVLWSIAGKEGHGSGLAAR